MAMSRCRLAQFLTHLSAMVLLLLLPATAGETACANQVVDGEATMLALAFDSDGRPSLAYLGPGANLRLARYDGTAWQSLTIDDTPLSTALGHSLAYDPRGYPAIAYNRNSGLWLAWYNGVSWDKLAIDVPSTSAPSLAFAGDGQPAVAYVPWSGSLTLAKLNGLLWQKELVPDGGSEPSLAYDALGRPSIALAQGGIYFTVKDGNLAGGGWSKALVQGFELHVSYSSPRLTYTGASAALTVSYKSYFTGIGYSHGHGGYRKGVSGFTGAGSIQTGRNMDGASPPSAAAFDDNAVFTVAHHDAGRGEVRLVHEASPDDVTEVVARVEPAPSAVALAWRGATAAVAYASPLTVITTAPAGFGRIRHRLYNPGTYEHLFTTDRNEADVLVATGWGVFENASHRLASGPIVVDGVSADPLYRLFNRESGKHLWTADANERATLLGFAWAWLEEGTDGWVFRQPVSCTAPLYRLYLAPIGPHHWTTDRNEYLSLTAAGWRAEGVAGYVFVP